MKLKCIILTVFAMLSQVANAQTFGIKGGLNVASMSFPKGEQDFSPKPIIGFQFGPVVELKLKESLYFNTGLLYTLKGSKLLIFSDPYAEDLTMGQFNLNCLDLPFNIAYKFLLNESSKFFVQAGPYLSYVLNGKAKSGSTSGHLQFGSEGQMKRFDFGIGIGTGIELGSIVTSLSYQHELTNRYGVPNFKVRNKVLQLSVAYMFRKSM